MGVAAPTLDLQRDFAARLAEARARTDELFRLVRPEALYDRPIPERHRIVFYLGHLEAFDWNLVCRGVFGREPFHAAFDRLFAFGIDPTSGQLPDDPPSAWPAIAEIEKYNAGVRGTMDACLREAFTSNMKHPHLEDGLIFHVAIEHRLMHAETLAYMLHQLPLDRKIAPVPEPAVTAPPVAPRMIEIPEGPATLGLVRTPETPFGWDNEFEPHTVTVPRFAIDAHKVTNGQYLEFLCAGGYEERGLWSDAAREWKTQSGIRHPAFWTRRGDRWFCRTMFTEIPLPLDWPVYVSHAEASAYARRAGKALPSEAQFHRAAYGLPAGAEPPYPWGSQPPSSERGNFDFARWDPAPVGAFPAGVSAFGVEGLLGNGWEWTSTVFEPFPGFERFPFYPGYSADFFDGKHFVMKGGSARTAACMLRRSFRNWFQPHYPYVYAAFRCVV